MSADERDPVADRFSLLDFGRRLLGRQRRRKPARAEGHSLYAPLPRPAQPARLMRADLDVLFFSLAVAACLVTLRLAQGEPARETMLSGVAVFFAVAAFCYLPGALSRPSADAARAIYDVRRVSASPIVRAVAELDEAEAAETQADAEAGLELTAADWHRELWAFALRRHLVGARLVGGFSFGLMCKTHTDAQGREVKPIMTGHVWRVMTPVLKVNAILADYPEGTAYAAGMDWGRAIVTLKHEPLTLPERKPPARILLIGPEGERPAKHR